MRRRLAPLLFDNEGAPQRDSEVAKASASASRKKNSQDHDVQRRSGLLGALALCNVTGAFGSTGHDRWDLDDDAVAEGSVQAVGSARGVCPVVDRRNFKNVYYYQLVIKKHALKVKFIRDNLSSIDIQNFGS